jgi:hypothetical protein
MAGMKYSSVSARRPRSSAAERAQWARRFHQSGLTQRDFASQEGLRLSTLQRWVRQAPLASAPPAFAELKFPAPSPRWVGEVVRPDGTVVRLASDAPPTWLASCLPPC